MSERERQGAGGPGDERYAPGDNPQDRNEHRHGKVVHSHEHTGPLEHGDDYEYDEAHDEYDEAHRTGSRPPGAPGPG